MKNLIVNADDFGASHGVNLGVIEAHRNGILTSASMMVDAAGSAEAGRISARHPDLGVGLHVVIAVAGRRTGDGGGGGKTARALHRADRATADAHRCAPQRPRRRALSCRPF